jgi:hypothetical protein
MAWHDMILNCVVWCGCAGGEWDEDDLIALEEQSAASKEKKTPPQEGEEEPVVTESPYFEYTDEPRAVSGKKSVLVGRARLKCPPYGGLFSVIYKRVHMDIIPIVAPPVPPSQEEGEGAVTASGKSNSIIIRTNRWLANSEVLSVPFSLQQLSPTARGGGIICRGNRGRGGLVKITEDNSSAFGAKFTMPPQFDKLAYLVEDMRNISTLAISIGTSDPSSSQVLSKASAWITPIKGTHTTALTVECDVSAADRSGSIGKEEDLLSYCVVLLPLSEGWSLDLTEAYGLVTEDKTSDSSGVCGNRLLIKIPYVRDADSASTTTHNVPPPVSTLVVIVIHSFLLPSNLSWCGTGVQNGEDIDLPMGLSCSFCSTLFLPQNCISSVGTLPSGLFDHVSHTITSHRINLAAVFNSVAVVQIMHEFVCSESTPTMPLSVTDMATPKGWMYLSDIFLSVNPVSLRPGALLFRCKQHPSLLDVVAGTGHIVENVHRAKDMHATAGVGGLCSSVGGDLQMVDASTCSVTCARCLSVVGDGQVAADDVADSRTAEDSSNGASEFVVSDLQDVRLFRDRVRWRSASELSGSQSLVGNLDQRYSSEKVPSVVPC